MLINLDKVQSHIQWLNARKKYITASMVNSLRRKSRTFTEVDGVKLSSAELDWLINRQVLFTERLAGPISRAAQWGQDQEVLKGEKYLLPKGYHHWDDVVVARSHAGCSPDYLDIEPQETNDAIVLANTIKPTKGCEVKCFEPKHHLKIVLTGEIDESILDQMAWYFYVMSSLKQMRLALFCDEVEDKKKRQVYYDFSREDMADRIHELQNLYAEFWKKITRKGE